MKLGPTRRVTKHKCLQCSAALTAVAAVDVDAAPRPGDVTICLKCGHLMVFAHDLSPREPNDEEMHEIAGDERVLSAQHARGKLPK